MPIIFRNLHPISNIIVRRYSPRFPFKNFLKEDNKSKLEPKITEYYDDQEGFGDYESDFMGLHKTHKEYERESKLNKEKLQHLIVGQKYFKVKQPNFLTYAEKEQIKLLYNKDPEEWTVEKLSESFPADPITIKKLIKGKWSARSYERIQAHDKNVWKNWQLLKEGKLPEIDEKLKEHLKRFSNRDVHNYKSLGVKIVPFELPKPRVTEFSSIITSVEKYNEPKETNLNNNSLKFNKLNTNTKNTSPEESETFLLGKIENRKEVRLSDLNLGNFKEIESKKDISIDGMKSHDVPTENMANEFETKEISILEKDVKTYEMTSNRDRIYIPKKVWKRGATYRVEDSYYGDDGWFLYRVPGMTGKN